MKLSDQNLEGATVGALLDCGVTLEATPRELVEASRLNPGDFLDVVARVCFQAILQLLERGRRVSIEAIAGCVQGLLPKDPSNQLLAWMSAPYERTRAHFLADAAELRRLSKLRSLAAFHQAQLDALALPKADPVELASAAEAFVQSFAGTAVPDESGDRDVLELGEDWDAYMRGVRTPFVPTGIHALDEHLGGWVANLNVVGGLPSVGKSALVGQTIMNHLQAGMKVGLFGLEDATKWLAKRHLARALGIRVASVAACRLDDLQAAVLAAESSRLHGLLANLTVYRRPGISPAELLQRCRHWVLNLGVRIIYVDHGGEVRHESQSAKDRHDLAVAATYRGLRDLAVNHRVPVVVLCHFNRDADGMGRPRPKSFAETAYIERMARLAIGLWEKDEDQDELLVEVLKVTEGERGVTLAVKRDRQFALVRNHGGRVVDYAAEKKTKSNGRVAVPWEPPMQKELDT